MFWARHHHLLQSTEVGIEVAGRGLGILSNRLGLLLHNRPAITSNQASKPVAPCIAHCNTSRPVTLCREGQNMS